MADTGVADAGLGGEGLQEGGDLAAGDAEDVAYGLGAQRAGERGGAGEGQEGQGLCPWTPLGSADPRPHG